MADSFNLTPHETVTVRAHTADLLEAEGVWGPGGAAPPAHLHPAQDEHFEVLEGELRAVVDGAERAVPPGGTLEVPRGAVHKMWNPGAIVVRAIWQTRPAGRTLDWWRAIDQLGRSHPPGRSGTPSLPRMAVLLQEYDDVFRLSVGPRPVTSAVVAALAAVGRRRS